MNKLVKIKIINWHCYAEQEIPVLGSTMIMGGNMSGKSTLADAITYVMTGGEEKFNHAASDGNDNKRTLIGYVRCQDAGGSTKFLRRGFVSTHLALEFYNENKKKYFTVGAAIDSPNETDKPKGIFYVVDNKRIEQIKFIDDDIPLESDDMRIQLLNYNKVSIEESDKRSKVRKMMMFALGTTDKKYHKILLNALAVKRIESVREFIETFLLEEHKVNIEGLKEDIDNLRGYNLLINETKLKLNELANMFVHHKSILSKQEEIDQIKCILKGAELERLSRRIDATKNDIKIAENEKYSYEKNIKLLMDEREDIDIQIKSLESTLEGNKEKREYERLTIQIEQYENENEELAGKVETLNSLAQMDLNCCTQLSEELNIHLSEYTDALANSFGNMKLDQFKNITDSTRQIIDTIKTDAYRNEAKYTNEMNRINKERKEIFESLRVLENEKIDIPRTALELKNSLSEQLSEEFDEIVTVSVVCEMIDINNDEWRDVIEGYLDDRRFDLIVNHRYSDKALEIFEEQMKSMALSKYGVVDSKKLRKDEPVEAGTLACFVESKSTDALRYVHSLLGNVLAVDEVKKLPTSKVGVTKDCFVYLNNVLYGLDESTYRIPYIGEKALVVQKKYYESRRNLLNQEYEELKEKLNKLNRVKSLCDLFYIESISRDYHYFIDIENNSIKIEKLIKSRDLIDSSTFIEKQILIDEYKVELKVVLNSIKDQERRLEDAKEKLFNVNRNLKDQYMEFDNGKALLDDMKESLVYAIDKVSSELEHLEKIKSIEKLISKHRNCIGELEIELEQDIDKLKEYQYKYCSEHNFNGDYGVDAMKKYYEEDTRLLKTELAKYTTQYEQLASSADEIFRTELIGHLYESIDNARASINKLNRILRKVKFGRYTYQYTVSKRKDFAEYYDMIMTEENRFGGFRTVDMSEEHKDAMDKMYRILTSGDSSSKEYKQFIDYRTYLDFDVIMEEDGVPKKLSDIMGFNSGAEGEIPYYVTIAASVNRMYKHPQVSSCGLVILDEAFSKFDEYSTRSMMEYFESLDIQPIIVLPSEKSQTVLKHVDTSIIVNRIENRIHCDVDRIRRKAI